MNTVTESTRRGRIYVDNGSVLGDEAVTLADETRWRAATYVEFGRVRPRLTIGGGNTQRCRSAGDAATMPGIRDHKGRQLAPGGPLPGLRAPREDPGVTHPLACGSWSRHDQTSGTFWFDGRPTGLALPTFTYRLFVASMEDKGVEDSGCEMWTKNPGWIDVNRSRGGG